MRQNLSRSVCCLLAAVAIVTSVTASPASADSEADSQSDADEVFHFVGGGFGHGVGMSQYGALGRAEAGFSHQEILGFYYEGTEVVWAPELVPDDVDVRIGVHRETTFTPTGLLTVAMDGRFLDTTVNRLKVRRGRGGWYINSSNIDWCRGFCPGKILTVSFNDGEPVRVANIYNGTRYYAHGQFQLTPAGAGVLRCGSQSSHQYCLVIGDMTMQQYLYGIDEVPVRWHSEALKAQAIAARSYAAGKIMEREGWSSPFDLYTSVEDQEYHAWDHENELSPERPWADIVDATDDIVVTYTPSPEENPDDDPADNPDSDPPDNPDSDPADDSENDPADNPDGDPTDDSENDPTDNPDGDPADKPDSDPPDDSENDPTDNPENYPTDNPENDPADDPESDVEARRVVVTFYSSSNGGFTAASEEPWLESRPYLLAKSDPYDAALDADGNPQNRLHTWYRPYSYADVSRWLIQYPLADLDVGQIQDIIIEDVGPSGRIDDALVTLVGSERTLEVRDSEGEPYGYRFYYALNRGCGTTPECRRMLSTRVYIADEPPNGNLDLNLDPIDTDLDSTDTSLDPIDTDLDPIDVEIGTVEVSHDQDGGLEGESRTVETLPFTDVDPDAVYIPAISWLYKHGITSGISETEFSPESSLSRAQFATFLWRFAGQPDPNFDTGFRDVAKDNPHRPAISWMVINGITEGCKRDYFCPHQPITMAQVATFLWRYASPQVSSDSESVPFNDIKPGSALVEPSQWMLKWDLWVDENYQEFGNDPSYSFRPYEPITRARMAVLLWRLANAPDAFATGTAPEYLREF